MDDIEDIIVMPEDASPYWRYDRTYAEHEGIVRGSYIKTDGLFGSREWSASGDLSFFEDAGCYQVNVQYSIEIETALARCGSSRGGSR